MAAPSGSARGFARFALEGIGNIQDQDGRAGTGDAQHFSENSFRISQIRKIEKDAVREGSVEDGFGPGKLSGLGDLEVGCGERPAGYGNVGRREISSRQRCAAVPEEGKNGSGAAADLEDAGRRMNAQRSRDQVANVPCGLVTVLRHGAVKTIGGEELGEIIRILT